MSHDAYLATIAFTAVVAVSCAGSDPLEPADIAGNYSATTLTVTPLGQPTVDVLAAAGTLTIVLATDGSTSGLLSVPAGVNGGTAMNESMIGTFALNGSVVRFTQTADTFVRDVDFTVEDRTLRASGVFTGAVVSVVLTRG